MRNGSRVEKKEREVERMEEKATRQPQPARIVSY